MVPVLRESALSLTGVGTVVFDFDSTLIPEESLEGALADAVDGDPAAQAEIARITNAGMEGAISFRASMEARLAIAKPTRGGLVSLGRRLTERFTTGAAELVATLHARGHEVWIVSGAFRDVLLPAAAALGIAPERVQGVRARWSDGGELLGLDPDDGFATSKVAGMRDLAPEWSRPSVGVGDGMTDHALWAEGVVDHFVPYLEHARRDAVLALGLPGVSSMEELSRCLETLLP